MSATCDYCGKDINRKLFCSPSHKVLYHRSGPKTTTTYNVTWQQRDFSKKKQASTKGLNK